MSLLWTYLVLALICILSFAIRLFPVVIWGTVRVFITSLTTSYLSILTYLQRQVIHEFDPQFNFRVTKFLAEYGIYELLDWFDDRAWYPLGRIVGTTVYPGLMAGAAGLQWLLALVLRLPISTRDACVFLAPAFAALACVAQFLLTHEVTGDMPTALLSAMLLSVSPAYISRTTAGSFDNEGIAIFLLIFTFYLWIKSIKSGAMLWAAFTAISYCGMALSWGGYVFIINIIPIHVLVLLLSRQYSARLYVAYSTFYPLVTLGAMQIPFIGFNAVLKGETAGSHGTFALLQAYALMRWLSIQLPNDQFMRLFRACSKAGIAISGIGLSLSISWGKLQWSGRSLTLLDPTYASKYIPIIASVGEHQPTVWSAYYFSLGPAMLFIPLGIFYSFQKLDPNYLFMIVYSTFAFYFSGIMVRLLLVLAPAACYMAAVGASGFMYRIIRFTRSDSEEESKSPIYVVTEKFTIEGLTEKEEDSLESHADEILSALAVKLRFQLNKTAEEGNYRKFKALQLLVFACGFLLFMHFRHSFNIARKVYSSTSLVFLTMNKTTNDKIVHDDYREAFAWLRLNTPEDAKILSWWDYGYQITTFANRTVLVDNNTWNNTHIATVGRILMSREDGALPILHSLGVDYVFLLFGGKVGMPGDDLDKLSWIVKISGGVFPDDVVESEYQVNGRYIFHENATLAMQESVLYKLSYFEFCHVESRSTTENENPNIGWDMSRRFRIAQRDITLHHFEHVFTSEAWMVRIYKVKK
ncbi:putative oligosaccharyl transferase, STT3 subunit [Plasmopara halstedii]